MMEISYKCRMTTEALEHLEMLQGSLALAKIEKFNDQLREMKNYLSGYENALNDAMKGNPDISNIDI